ncbi:MAG: nucleotidyltransferase [Verrucomicrobiaceae bacterium]|nr:MAG: nucleotidyltransferase [Verrucomicrobiaceae bacterium]
MNKTLLVLAAGMGSRYGGLKQLDGVGPSGEVVLDYSVHDALWAGFNKVVFVIRRDFRDEFEEIVVRRYHGQIAIELAFQELDDLPERHALPLGRQKPWGTGHAIRAARHLIHEPFLVVNADDFYGMEAYSKMAVFLDRPEEGLRFGMVAYTLSNTLSEHGEVSRGVCTVAADQTLIRVEEHTGIVRNAGEIRGTDTTGEVRQLTGTEMVSMNFWGFTQEVFPHLEDLFGKFLDSGGNENPKSEFYIPSAVSEIIASGAAPASVIPSAGRWFGVTYKEDRESVASALGQMVKDRLYPTPLWNHIS